MCNDRAVILTIDFHIPERQLYIYTNAFSIPPRRKKRIFV